MIATLILPILLGTLQAPTHMSFDDAIKDFNQHSNQGRISQTDRTALTKRVAGEIDYETLDRKQAYTLCMYGFSLLPDVRPKILARLDALPAPDNAEKARIAYTRAFALYSTPDAGSALKSALAAPGTSELMNSADSSMVFYVLFCCIQGDKPNMAASMDKTMNWLKKTDHMDSWDHGVMSMFYDWTKTDLPKDTALLAKIRSVCGALDKRSLDKGKLSAEDRPRVEMDYLAFTGPALNGKLIGHKSPEIDFRWCSDPNIHKLSDYAPGHVVILDFWTTWCQPCVAAFPHIRELVDHYKGMPVTFLGVTSIQGADYDPDGRIDCKGDPAKETGLMPSFMKKKDMTWTVAFSTKDAFDPNFGVHDIPHMAIVDANGVVRYNELRPSLTTQEFEALIDPLLAKQVVVKSFPGPEIAKGRA